jgi:hypothetical protein
VRQLADLAGVPVLLLSREDQQTSIDGVTQHKWEKAALAFLRQLLLERGITSKKFSFRIRMWISAKDTANAPERKGSVLPSSPCSLFESSFIASEPQSDDALSMVSIRNFFTGSVICGPMESSSR